MQNEVHDFVVIGAGSAGAVVAARLSEDPACRVLLLEAGRDHRHPFVSVPALMMFSFPRPDMNWQYMAEPDASRGNRPDMWPGGRMLGGGSSLNGMMFVRGHAYDYDLWAQMGNRGWSNADVLPYFRKLEASDTGPNDQRGGDGPLAVERPRPPFPLVKPFIRACEELGLGTSEDLNGEKREGAGVCQASQRRGRRESTAHAYLDPAQGRKNLQIVTGALVQKVLIENGRAVGVRVSIANKVEEIRASQGVVLCAGAIATPKLMMLSGIGDPDEIAGHGIEVVHASSAVGKNLMEHSGASVSVEVSVPTLTSDQGPIRSPIHVLDYLLNRRGPLATPIGHAQAFVRTEEGLAAPDIQIILSPSSYEIKDGKARRRKTPQMGFAVGLCRPQARGQIRLRSADPAAPPLIDHKLFGEKADVDRIAAGIRIALKIVGAPAFAPFVKKVVGPLDTSDEGLDAYIRETGYLMYHPSGTCKMAPGADGVVDDRLRVKGIDRLWIADASIIPTIPAGNINATCIMIGEKAADLIRQDSTDQRKAA